MSQRRKGQNGNGERAQAQTNERQNMPARASETAQMPSRTGETGRLPSQMMHHPFAQLRHEIDALFDHFFGRTPAPFEGGWGADRFWDVNVEDTGKEIMVRAEAPGFEPKDFDIDISGNTLTIRAEHKQEAEEKQGDFRTWERRYGQFQRSVLLPAAVDADKVEAHFRNGILELRLPRTEEAQKRRIEVKA